MLIRHTTEGFFQCISQRQHAVLSGWLAAQWSTPLDPLLLAAITMHDDPWLTADLEPTLDPESGLPYSFVSYPTPEKIAFYRQGMDVLEDVDPYIALLVSLHYTTFSGTRDLAELQVPEAKRRSRLEDYLGPDAASADSDDLKWLRFFDLLSLVVCLTGPSTQPNSTPGWLEASAASVQAPDGTQLSLTWRNDQHVLITPWPFRVASLRYQLHLRRLVGRARNATEFEHLWEDARLTSRLLLMTPGA